MAKKHSIVNAIGAITKALRLESIPNPTDEQKAEIHAAKVQAADIVDDSNFMIAGENADTAIAEAEEDVQPPEPAEDNNPENAPL